MKIKGVIHICQVGDWKRSLSILMKSILSSGLYDVSESIDFCILSHRLEDVQCSLPKVNIYYKGHPALYERPSLLHLHEKSSRDIEEVYYWYLHTKGLRWFGTDRERNVLDWIDLLLYWNVHKWKEAVLQLGDGFDVYGCNQTFIPVNHYSGNFWWAKSSYIKTLPNTIGSEYNDPEFWIMKSQPKWYCVFRSGLEGMGHYFNRYPSTLYVTKTSLKKLDTLTHPI